MCNSLLTEFMMFKFWIMELLAEPLIEKILAFHYLMHVYQPPNLNARRNLKSYEMVVDLRTRYTRNCGYTHEVRISRLLAHHADFMS